MFFRLLPNKKKWRNGAHLFGFTAFSSTSGDKHQSIDMAENALAIFWCLNIIQKGGRGASLLNRLHPFCCHIKEAYRKSFVGAPCST